MFPVVSVDEVKEYLKVEYDEENGVIESLIEQAQSTAETYCRVEFVPESVPPQVKLAIMLMTAHYFEGRDNSDKSIYATMRASFENLLYPYRNPDKMF